MKPILLVHGNGGSRTRFEPSIPMLQAALPNSRMFIPSLSGFDGRPLPKSDNYWDVFIQELSETVEPEREAEWVLYGHGIGGSLLMEWGARGFPLQGGGKLKVSKVILHSIIGAALEVRFFPQLMKTRPVRWLMKKAIVSRLLRPIWIRRLFRHPENIPSALRNQFFEDYRSCDAFSVFFDLIVPEWYQAVRPSLQQLPLIFLWGEKERILKAEHLPLWKQDFPQAQFEVVPSWDHFPMLDEPEDFVRKFVLLATSR
ncbi:MAG: alpha/beta hydrolase [Bacteroidota bacterium]